MAGSSPDRTRAYAWAEEMLRISDASASCRNRWATFNPPLDRFTVDLDLTRTRTRRVRTRPETDRPVRIRGRPTMGCGRRPPHPRQENRGSFRVAPAVGFGPAVEPRFVAD